MTTRLLTPLGLLYVTLAVLAALPTPVSAEVCGPFPCEPAFVAPVAGASIPANVPAFPLIPEAVYGLGADAGFESGPVDAMAGSTPTPTIELLDPLGQVVPVDIVLAVVPGSGTYNIIPRTTLVPGTYRFRQPITCRGSATSAPVVLPTPSLDDQPFSVTPAAPLPTTVGSVTVSASQMTSYRIGAVLPDGGCSKERAAAVATLAFTPSPELAPFLPVARFEVCLDDAWCWFTNWGNIDIEPHPASQPFYDKFFTLCPPEEFGPGLAEGAHTGLFTARLPGQEPLPAVPFSFTLSCANAVVEPSGVVSDARPGSAADLAPLAPGPDGALANGDGGVAADVPAIGDALNAVPPGLDVGTLAADAAAAVDTPQAPPTGDGVNAESGASGCQCSLTRKDGDMAGVLWLLGLAILGRARSKRRRSGRV